MKANVARLIEKIEESRGTENSRKYLLSCDYKDNKKWDFIGWAIPSNETYDVIGTKSGIYLINEEKDQRFLLKAEVMILIDFI